MTDTDDRDSEIDRVITALRAGKRAQVGGGRSFATYEVRDGQLLKVTSDDGYTEEIAISEAQFRQVVTDDRALFADYLRMWALGTP